MGYNMTFDIAGVIISVILLFYFDSAKKSNLIQNKIFRVLLLINIISGLLGVLNTISAIFLWPLLVHEIINSVLFLCRLLFVIVLFQHALYGIKEINEYSIKVRMAFFIPMALGILFLISNPFFHFLFSVDQDYLIVRESGFYFLYLINLYYIGTTIVCLIYYRFAYNSVKKIVYATVSFFIVISGIIYLINPKMMIETFAYVYGLMIIFFVIQNPHNQIDSETNLLNKNSFISVIDQNLILKRNCYVIVLILQDFDDLDRNLGNQDETSMVSQITSYLLGIDKTISVYRYDKNIFALEITKLNEKATDIIVNKINERFRRPWQFGQFEILYNYKLCKMSIPDEISSVSSLISIVSGCLSIQTNKEIINVQDFDLDKLEREKKIHSAVKNAIDSDIIKLSFSPVYSIGDKMITGLQISSYFTDEEVGFVNEYEMKPVIEKVGKTTEIGCKLFEKLCNFIVDVKPEKYGITSIFIKVSSIMCIQSGFVNYMTDYLESMGINPKNIIFLISEYNVSRTEETIVDLLPELQEKGYRFCLDNYGKGFTNLASVYEYKFDFLKIDRSVTNNAINDKKAAITLKSTIGLARNLKMKTFISGIESQEYIDFAESLSCDYIRGTHFLEEISEKEILDVLKIQAENLASSRTDEKMVKGGIQ